MDAEEVSVQQVTGPRPLGTPPSITLHFCTRNHTYFSEVSLALQPCPTPLKGTRTSLGAALDSVPKPGRPCGLFFSFRHSLFLKMDTMYLQRRNDSMFSVNSYITFIPLLVSPIWSIYEVFHLILFWGQTACLEKMDRQLSKMDPGAPTLQRTSSAQGWKEAPPVRTRGARLRGTRMGPGDPVEQTTSLLPLLPAGTCISRDECEAQRQTRWKTRVSTGRADRPRCASPTAMWKREALQSCLQVIFKEKR